MIVICVRLVRWLLILATGPTYLCSPNPNSNGQATLWHVPSVAGIGMIQPSEVLGEKPMFVDAFLDVNATTVYVILNFKHMDLWNSRLVDRYYRPLLNATWRCAWRAPPSGISGKHHLKARKFIRSESLEAFDKPVFNVGTIVSDAPHGIGKAHDFVSLQMHSIASRGDRRRRVVEDRFHRTMVVSFSTDGMGDTHNFLDIKATSNAGIVVYERKNVPVSKQSVFRKNFKTALCTQVTNVGIGRDKYLYNWIKYNLHIGFEHVLLYVEEYDDAWVQTVVSEFIADGDVTLVPFFFEGVSNSKNWKTQEAMNQHCVYQAKGRVEWLAHADIDEYFQPMGEYRTIKDFIARVEDSSHYAGFQVRSQFWRAPNASSFAKAKQNGSMPCDLTCKAPKYQAEGTRTKMLMNPQNVRYLTIHWISVKERGIIDIVDPDASLRINHFKNWGGPTRDPCNDDYSFRDRCRDLIARR